jgi:hypothetical protein
LEGEAQFFKAAKVLNGSKEAIRVGDGLALVKVQFEFF